ncbi:GlxA family transcriptional regulator [Frankia nepalensis]|uniref:GlxA family transcriptional regulator n=1 Tax=Frankia nepalensis TaxID=1836974 RepID=UPI0027DE2B04|nr:GlxA family transcriptional regulator [Frankia nepalensis]
MTSRRAVVIAVFDGVELLDVTGPASVFATATRLLAASLETDVDTAATAGDDGDEGGSGTEGPGSVGYRVTLVGPRAGPIRATASVQLVADASFAEATDPPCDTVIIPGGLEPSADGPAPIVDRQVVDWLARTHRDARRVASVCAGAHMLATAGLLDGRSATTHWFTAPRLAAEFPRVAVDPDPIFIRSGRIWTCAGVTSGMDLALAMVADDHGSALALAVARWMVMYLRRPGGQSQFSVPLSGPGPARDELERLRVWIVDNLDADLSVAALARRARMSERHFARVFAAQCGVTPAAYVDAARVEAARRLLEETDQTLDAVATRCGFGSVETLHRSFRRRLTMTPAQYRQRFRLSA